MGTLKTRYTSDDVSLILKQYGFKLNKFYSSTNIIAEDNIGYKYKLTLTNLRSGRKPNRFANKQFAIYNIKRYLELNCPTYELLDNEYIGIKHKMRFICHKHLEKGIQFNNTSNIVHSHHYCKYCSYEQMRDDRVLDLEIVKELCNERNVIYYGRFTKNHETVIQYICDKHSEIVQEMSLTHFRESCAPCKYCGITSGEYKIANFLSSHNISYIKEKTFDGLVSDSNKKLRFDFYLPEYNIIIEYDGRQHFESVKFWNGQNAEQCLIKNQYHDKLKNNYCKNNNIKLIRIPYTKFNHIDEILASELSDAILFEKL